MYIHILLRTYVCNIYCANTRFLRSGIKLPLHYVVCHATLLVTAPCLHPHCWSLPLASILTAGHCPLPPSSLLVTAPCLHPHCWSLPLASILTAGHCTLPPSSLDYVAGDEDCSCRGHFPGGASGGKGWHTSELHACSKA